MLIMMLLIVMIIMMMFILKNNEEMVMMVCAWLSGSFCFLLHNTVKIHLGCSFGFSFRPPGISLMNRLEGTEN